MKCEKYWNILWIRKVLRIMNFFLSAKKNVLKDNTPSIIPLEIMTSKSWLSIFFATRKLKHLRYIYVTCELSTKPSNLTKNNFNIHASMRFRFFIISTTDTRVSLSMEHLKVYNTKEFTMWPTFRKILIILILYEKK